MDCGIYAIVNKRTGGWYVGQEARKNKAEATRRAWAARLADPVAYAAWGRAISEGKRRKKGNA